MKKFLVFLLVILFLAACQLKQEKGAPKGEISVNNKDYQMVYAGYEWIDGNLEIRAPRMGKSIFDYTSDFDTLTVSGGSEVIIDIEKAPDTIEVQQYNLDGEMETVNLVDNKILLPAIEDYYVYEVVAKWENGSEVTFIFDIELSD
ncbi:hypothetical protein [Bacillus ndiopicus]|uniref:hypothetical protein n=1 Tax=Bacillus ndiopicus TaxID=1347368 RepID=UPI0005A948D3|nr:hypothetical protein [Bacillus ndiopicus]